MEKTIVSVVRKVDLPTFGLWSWTQNDYAIPLPFELGDSCTGHIVLEPHFVSDRKLEPFPNGRLELVYSNPDKAFLQGLEHPKGKHGNNTAARIYSDYKDVMSRFEALLLTTGGVRNLISQEPDSWEKFFGPDVLVGSRVNWTKNGEQPRKFEPKIHKVRGRLPVFSRQQLITPAKWKRLTGFSKGRIELKTEVLELLRIRTKTQWRDKKVPALEAAILVETVLRDYVKRKLSDMAFSKTKLEGVRDELSFNNMLNLLLPLTLTKGKLQKLQPQIEKINALRKLRNDIVHGEIVESDIDSQIVVNGIDAALTLVRTIVASTPLGSR